MSKSRRHSLWRLTTAVLFAAGLAVVASGLAQTSNGKWWPGYGNGADNSRYFASRQINKSNVSRLQAASKLLALGRSPRRIARARQYIAIPHRQVLVLRQVFAN
jgi:hypothetical protein